MALTAEHAPSAGVGAPGRTSRLEAQLSGGRFLLVVCGAALVIAAVSLLIPSTPSYDPWSWLVWGREIIHLDLHTSGGPSWKPLTVIFTTVFALFGKAAPDLWLVVARAGAVMAVVMVFRLSFRLIRAIGGTLTQDSAVATYAPALIGAAIAAVSLAFSDGFLS